MPGLQQEEKTDDMDGLRTGMKLSYIQRDHRIRNPDRYQSPVCSRTDRRTGGGWSFSSVRGTLGQASPLPICSVQKIPQCHHLGKGLAFRNLRVDINYPEEVCPANSKLPIYLLGKTGRTEPRPDHRRYHKVSPPVFSSTSFLGKLQLLQE